MANAPSDDKSKVSRKDAAVDTTVVIALSVAYAIAELSHVPKRWIIPCIALALFSYALIVWRRRKESWRDFGLRMDNLAKSALPVALWTAAAALLMLVWAHLRNVAVWRVGGGVKVRRAAG